MLDGSERAVARVMLWARRAEEAVTPPPSAPRHTERFEALCEQLRQETIRIRRTRPACDDGAPPGDAVTVAARRNKAMAQLEALEDALERQRLQERANADQWRRRAELAVAVGDDDLAREALARAREHASLTGGRQRELDVGHRVAAELRSALLAAEASGHPSG